MSYVTDPAQPTKPSAFRYVRFPLIVLAIFTPLVLLPWFWNLLRLPEEGVLPTVMASQFAALLGILILTVWWIFFSGVPWLLRLGLFVVVSAGVVAAFMSVGKIEVTMNTFGLVPRIPWLPWQSSPEEKLAKHLEEEKQKNDDLPAIDATIGVEDFARYRGAKADGIIRYAQLQTDWDTHRPEILWKLPCPGGYGGIAVAGNIAVTLQQRGEQEVVVCYDRATGRERWAYAYDANYKDIMGDGPRSTPTIHDGRIFTCGATGELLCLGVDGKKQWQINILEDSRAKNIKWGLTGSPLIVDDLVIAHAGHDPNVRADASLVAFEQKTGKKRWATGDRPAGYSSPHLATLAGVPQILLFDGAGLVAYDPKSGRELWNTPWITKFEMNMIQPVIIGSDQVFVSSEASPNGCALFRIKTPDNSNGWRVETVWKNKNLGARFANPVTDGKHIFGLHSLQGELRCLDVADGSIKWQGDRQGPGQMLLIGDHLLVMSAEGVLRLFATDAADATELARFTVFNDKTWNTPSFAGNQLFVRNQMEIACIKMPRK